MAILVICPGCSAQFKVNEKFAGKQGPCPKCKAVITIPNPSDIKIHMPEEFEGGGKNAQGKLITKPISREKTRIKPWVAAVGVAGTLVVLAVAWFGAAQFEKLLWLRAIGLLLISPPLVAGAYSVLRNDELEPYRGLMLWLRVGICALVYAGLWGVYAMLPDFLTPGEPWAWLLLAPPFIVVGAGVALATLDLEFGAAAVHYSGYVLATIVMRMIIGMPPIWKAITREY